MNKIIVENNVNQIKNFIYPNTNYVLVNLLNECINILNMYPRNIKSVNYLFVADVHCIFHPLKL